MTADSIPAFIPELNWFIQLFTEQGIPQTIMVYGVVIAFGIWLGRIKIAGVSVGVT